MAPKLIYYGTDNSHRLSVLRAAGYVVENCKSAPELISFLEYDAEILVILFADEEGEPPLEAVDVVRARCSALLMVFRDSTTLHDEIGFDFIIPNLTPPAEWLRDIASLIERNRRVAQFPSNSGSDSGKAQSIDPPPSKIKRIERDSASPADPDLRNFGPPRDQATTDPAGGAGPRCLV